MALNGALIVNAAILVLAAAVFFTRHTVVEEIEQAHQLLSPLLGTTLASGLFAVALLASGQSSTLTGTYAGQIVMEGFLDLRMRPWMRRLITRTAAIIPAVTVIQISGDGATLGLLLVSQAIISMQLPFAVIPLIRFTNDRQRMGEFANRAWVKALAWATAAVILGLNLWLVGAADERLGAAASVGLRGDGSGAGGHFGLAGMDYVCGSEDGRLETSGNRTGGECSGGGSREPAGSGVPADSGAAGSQLARSRGDRACGVPGPAAWSGAAPGARGRRRDQPVIRTAGFGRGGASRARSICTASSSRWRGKACRRS